MKKIAVFLTVAAALSFCCLAGCSAGKVEVMESYLYGTDYELPGGGGVGQGSRLSRAYSWLLSNYGSISRCYKLSSDGSFLSVDTNPSDLDSYLVSGSAAMVEGLNEYFGFPSYVWNDMLSTSAVDGRQSASYGGITVTWRYHPDRGLEATYRLSY